MINLTIDGKSIAVAEGTVVIEAAKQLGIDIPYACYHRHLRPYGGCRVCLVEIERMPKLQTSCTTVVTEGMVVRTDTPAVIIARQGEIEFLLANHPLECPVCDKGGECELQALSYYHGRGESRFHEPKRHSEDYDFGPLVRRNMDRCIRCKRCVRFMDEVACERVLNYGDRGPNTVVDTFDGGRFESRYSGNTVTICPVGALLNEPFVHRTRVWESVYVDTVCPHCANGCNMRMSIRRNAILRHIARENPEVNGPWLCDRGQFGFGFVNSRRRLDVPLVRKDGTLVESTWDEALTTLADRLSDIKRKNGPDSIGGVGSALCTNEDNYLFQKFMRSVIGTNNVDYRADGATVSDYTPGYRGALSLQGIRAAKSFLLFGCDLAEEQPVTALWVREAVRWNNAHLTVANTVDVEENRFADELLRFRPGTELLLIKGMISLIMDEDRARAEGFEKVRADVSGYTLERTSEVTGVPGSVLEAAARSFAAAEGGVIIYGSGVLGHPYGQDIVQAISVLAAVTGNAGRENGGIFPALPDCNSHGAADVGLLPDMLPGRVPLDRENLRRFSDAWGVDLPSGRGLDVRGMLRAAADGELKAMFVMGADPASQFPDSRLVKEAFEKVEFLVVQDVFLSETARLADVVLPGKTYAEKDGTFTAAGRAVQSIRQGMPLLGPRSAEWYTLCRAAAAMGVRWEYRAPSQVMDEIAGLVPEYECRPEVGGTSSRGEPERAWSLSLPDDLPEIRPEEGYPLLLLTRRLLLEGDARVLESEPLAGLVPEPWIEISSGDAKSFGIADGVPVNISSSAGSITLPARVTERCSAGTVVVPDRLPGPPVRLLMDSGRDWNHVRIEKA